MKYSKMTRNQRRSFHRTLTRTLIAEKANVPVTDVRKWILDQKDAGKFEEFSNKEILQAL